MGQRLNKSQINTVGSAYKYLKESIAELESSLPEGKKYITDRLNATVIELGAIHECLEAHGVPDEELMPELEELM